METKYVHVCMGMFAGESCNNCPRYGSEECSIKNSPSVKFEDIKNRRFNLKVVDKDEDWENWYNK